MKRLRIITAAAIAAAITAWGAGFALAAPAEGAAAVRRAAAAKVDNTVRCDANNLDFVVTNHGSLMLDLTTGESGLVYPRGTTKTAVFAAGLWLGAKVNDSLRVSVGEYSQEYSPGPIEDGTAQPDNARFRVYKIRRGDTSSRDYLEWPVQDGAPVDSAGHPLCTGDVTLWCVYNDADPAMHLTGAGRTRPLGVEVQQTVFAFNQQNPLADCAFIRFRLINKGGNALDSMYVAFWSDPDLGGANDDLVGCDTTRSLGYAYNATNSDPLYGKTPPAVGFDFFQGPLVDQGGEPVRLPMSSFNRYTNGTDPVSSLQSYYYMQGLSPDGEPYEYPPGTPVSFQVSGDPVTGDGDVDVGPSDRRMQLSTGPFAMAPGDTQEIVVGVVLGQGVNRLSSVRVMQKNDDFAQAAYDLGFRIAVPPPSPVVAARAFDKAVDLVWDDAGESVVSSNTELGQEYHFQGYNVYQGESAGGPWHRVVTFDIVDSIDVVYDEVFSPEVGAYQRVVVQQGPNEGLDHHLRLTTDALRGGRLVNNRDYYYAVTAYSLDLPHTGPYEINGAPVGHLSPYPLESGIAALHVRPMGSGAVLAERADHTAGAGDAEVELEYLDPRAVSNADYQVLFEEDGEGLSWSLVELGATTKTILQKQRKFDGDFTYPVVNGIMVRVIKPEAGAKSLVEICANGESRNALAEESGGCSGEWTVDPQGTQDLGRLTRFNPPWDERHDYEVRFLADSTEFAWDFFGREDFYSGRFAGRVPWEVWDLGIGTPSDPSDDVRICGMIAEGATGESGVFDWGDGIYLRNIPYDSVDWSAPDLSSEAYDPNDEMLGYGRLFLVPTVDEPSRPWPAEGSRLRLSTYKAVTQSDVFSYRAKAVGTSDGTLLTGDSRIYPVPNPYYNRSNYELTTFDRVVRFSYLPSRPVTIRIFNMAGDLVRSLRKSDPTAGTLDWNLQSDSGVSVASGLYVWVAEVEGAAAQRGTMAVFVEKERLNTF